jgi:hypothetical protein
LRWAQIAWVVLVTASLLMYAAGSVVNFGQLRQLCTLTAEQCAQFDYASTAEAAQLAAHGLSLDAYALLVEGFRIILTLVPITLAILIFVRRRDEPIALLVSFFLASYSTSGGAQSVLAAEYPIFTIFTQIIEWLGIIALPLFFGLFPNGRMVPRLYWGVVAYFSIGYFLQATLGLEDINSPIGTFWAWTGWLSVLLGGVAAQIYRYLRVSTPVERQQTRWVLFGMGVMAAFLLGMLAYVAITGNTMGPNPDDTDLLGRFAFLAVLSLGFEVVFLSIGLAILRSKLFDIDVIIRKTLVYAVLSVLLALVYFGTVILLQSVFDSISGQLSPVAIVLSTLVIAALFTPLRQRVQSFIDRRFFRKKYDAQQVLAQFAQNARDEVSLEALTAELLRVVQETMQPELVNIWLSATQTGHQPMVSLKDERDRS